MKQSVQVNSTQGAAYPLSRPWRVPGFLRGANSRLCTLTVIAVVVAWLPPADLSLDRGGAAFLSFLTDYAFQTRFLIILPVLILAMPNLNNRHATVVHRLEECVPENQLTAFRANWTSFERVRDSKVVRAMIVLLTYALVIFLTRYLSGGNLSWMAGGSGFDRFWPAGTCATFISYPIVAYITLLWLWRHLLWTRFMRSIARLDLRLIAVHPGSCCNHRS